MMRERQNRVRPAVSIVACVTMRRMRRSTRKHRKQQPGRGCIVTSGAYGTELQARGLKPGESADAWNLLRPDDVKAVARAYVEAGADIIVANTFQANPLSLEKHGWHEMAREINMAGVELAREAARARCPVFGSIGPIGAAGTLEAAGPAGEMMSYWEQLEALLDAGVDGIVLETFTAVDEIVRALQDVATGEVEVFALMSFPSGDVPPHLVHHLRAEGAAGVGVNCMAPDAMLPICRDMRAVTKGPVWMKPCAGLPRREGERLVYDMTPDEFADGCMALVDAGADLIGGCCGAGPEHIRALVERVRRKRRGKRGDEVT